MIAVLVFAGLSCSHVLRRDVCKLASVLAVPAVPHPAVGSRPPSALYTWEEVPGVDIYTPDGNSRRRYALLTHANGVRGLVCCDEAYTRCEIAVSVACGSLDDPPELEGLAHLCEHVTLATDPADLSAFIEERQGDTNAFTGERTTSFYTGFDLGKRVMRTPSATTASKAVEAALREDVSGAAMRFAALFSRALSPTASSAAPLAVVREEVGRIDAELQDIAVGFVDTASHPHPSSSPFTLTLTLTLHPHSSPSPLHSPRSAHRVVLWRSLRSRRVHRGSLFGDGSGVAATLRFCRPPTVKSAPSRGLLSSCARAATSQVRSLRRSLTRALKPNPKPNP